MSSQESPGSRGAATILVAEDHADSRDALRTLLEAAGYEVALAHNGREAVERALALRPDLVVMDLMMPEMDGLEATRVLRASPGFERTPIIALTALEGGRERALDAGCDSFASKPLNVPSFFRMVEEWLRKRRESRNGSAQAGL